MNATFQKTVWAYYRAHGRHSMPWRLDTSPYSVVVSEIMLQQTQVSRVEAKFASWMKRFPTWKSLADASTKDVLQEWSGLGYNRRALYLKRIAEKLCSSTQDAGTVTFPSTYDALRELPGIGPNTAGAILAYVFNEPHPFIETNIRSAYIHVFFSKSRVQIPDSTLLPLIAQTLADPYIRAHAREWYWALMDYGSYIKSKHPNPSRKSAHHVKQSPFTGSNRELRANILKFILKKPASATVLQRNFSEYPPQQVTDNLIALYNEGFLTKVGRAYTIA